MKRISKKVREEAALLCAIATSSEFGICEAAYRLSDNIDEYTLQIALDAQAVACRGFRRLSLGNYGLTYAEAEALLRTGWSPS